MSTFKGIQVGVIPLFLGVGCLPPPSPGTDVLVSESGTSSSAGPGETSTTDSPTDTSVVTSTGTSTEADSSTSISSSTSAAVCGDGVVESGEECDDGDVDNANTCTNECKKAYCGDGQVHVGVEGCDDGNTDEADACLNDCTLAKCGDGKVHAGVEDCDDGNTDEIDACLNDCTAAGCGDGKVHVGVEGCDDGNQQDDDECSNECIAPRYVFVSSAAYTGNLGGVTGGNDKCKTLADASNNNSLKGKNWRAWLSDGVLPLMDAINGFEGWYRLPGGIFVAKGSSKLFSGALTNSISVDEKGGPQAGVVVWTGTQADGLVYMTSHCSGWLSSDKMYFGLQGYSGAKDSAWTDYSATTCNSMLGHIYCVQIPG